MNYEKTVKLVSEYLARELKLGDREKDRIRFGFELLISTVISLSVSLILGGLLGILKAVIFVLIAGSVLKILAGGIHFETIWECGIFTGIITNLLGLISTEYHNIIYNNWRLFLLISSFYIIVSLLLWSPADVPQRPIADNSEIRFFKTFSILVSLIILVTVSSLFYFYKDRFAIESTGLVSGMLFQVFAINPLAYRLQKYYYQIKGCLGQDTDYFRKEG